MINMHYLHVGSKPATYLLSPKRYRTSIILCSSWSFSVVNPVVDVIKDPEWSSVAWDINIHKTGGIKHKGSLYPCDHLSWRAVCNGKHSELTPNDLDTAQAHMAQDAAPHITKTPYVP
jgi:hypothetical protein